MLHQQAVRTNLLHSDGTIFATICWCLSDQDVFPLSATALLLKNKIIFATHYLRTLSAYRLYNEGFKLQTIHHEDAHVISSALVQKRISSHIYILRSSCLPLKIRRIQTSLLEMPRTCGGAQQIWPAELGKFSLVAFEFLRDAIEDNMFPEYHIHYSNGVKLSHGTLKLRLTLRSFGTFWLQRQEQNIFVDCSQTPSADDVGCYTILLRSLTGIGTQRQVDLQSIVSILPNGNRVVDKRSHCLYLDNWTRSVLEQYHCLYFFVIIWKATPQINF